MAGAAMPARKPQTTGKTITNLHELLEEVEAVQEKKLEGVELKLRRAGRKDTPITFADLCELEAVGPKPMGSEERNGYIELLRKISPYTRDVERAMILNSMKHLAAAKLLGTPTEEPYIEGLDDPEPPTFMEMMAGIAESHEEKKPEAPAAEDVPASA
jgi:hypothetical protein